MVEGRRADGKGGHGNRSHHCGFRSKKVGRAMVGCGDCSHFSWQPSFWCWALGLVPCGAAHTRARRGGSLAIAMRMAEQSYLVPFCGTLLKARPTRRADIIGTSGNVPRPLSLPFCPLSKCCKSVCLYCCICSFYREELQSSSRLPTGLPKHSATLPRLEVWCVPCGLHSYADRLQL